MMNDEKNTWISAIVNACQNSGDKLLPSGTMLSGGTIHPMSYNGRIVPANRERMLMVILDSAPTLVVSGRW